MRSLRTAHHEAAHAVVHALFGGRGLFVEIYDSPRKASLGRFVHDKRQTKLQSAFDGLKVTAAGCVAEYLWHGGKRSVWQENDFQILIECGCSPENTDEVFELTIPIVRKAKSHIWRLADLLLAHGKVDVRSLT